LARRLHMKFALVNQQRQEAQPELLGQCPSCGHPMVAKCGEVKIWHWAHQGKRSCDPWWENETEWHRKWKAQFPDAWQEVVHRANDGTKHIADVKTDRGWVIEFQHSYLKPEERRSREDFYPKLIWVVDGMRRKKDSAQLLQTWDESVQVAQNLPLRRVLSANGALLRDWAGGSTPVFFDFAEQPVLWWLFAKNTDSPVYIAPYQRTAFIDCHSRNDTEKSRQFGELVNNIPKLIEDYESHLRTQAPRPDPLQIMSRRGRGVDPFPWTVFRLRPVISSPSSILPPKGGLPPQAADVLLSSGLSAHGHARS